MAAFPAMQATFTVEEVIEKVLNSDEEEDEEEEYEEKEENRADDGAIESWLDSFPAPEGFNRELFRDIGKEVWKPIIQQCSVSCNHGELQSTERSKGRPFSRIYVLVQKFDILTNENMVLDK